MEVVTAMLVQVLMMVILCGPQTDPSLVLYLPLIIEIMNVSANILILLYCVIRILEQNL